MASTSDIRKGLCIKYNHDIFKIIEFMHVKPGKGPAFVRTKLKSVTSGKVIDNTFSAGHKIEDVRVETHKFQKTKLNINCASEDNIFTIYKNLRTKAVCYNILMRPLEQVNSKTGICRLTKDSFIVFNDTYRAMITFLHSKLTSNEYLTLLGDIL